MKRLIFIISVIFISFQFTAQTNNTNQSTTEKSSKRVEASELKKKNSNPLQVSTKKKIMTQKHSKKSIDPKVKHKNKTILKPRQ